MQSHCPDVVKGLSAGQSMTISKEGRNIMISKGQKLIYNQSPQARSSSGKGLVTFTLTKKHEDNWYISYNI